MPSTSGRAASHPRREDKLAFFHELKKLVDGLKQRRSDQPGPAAPIPGHTATGSEEKLTPVSPQAEGKEIISMGSGT